jgi:hypothetical protein
MTHHPQDAERRVCQRTRLQRVVRVETSTGETIQGETLDVSLGGVLLSTRSDINHIAPDQSAVLFIVMPDRSLSSGFPCTIRRIQEHRLGLELDRNAAPAFGKALTRRVLSRKA